MILILIGLSFVVLRQSGIPVEQKIQKNKAEAALNSNKIASQNENIVQIPKSLLNSPQTAFIEPADLAREIEALETNFPQDERYKDVGKKLLPPRNQESLDRLVETLKGFGDYFARPFEELTDPQGEFAAKDAEVMQQIKETFQNPSHFALGEQCGLPGAAFSYPPGSDAGATACGGTPGFGGTSCNTSPRCYFSGRCFYVCFRKFCTCIVQSCYGACGSGSAYIWDSVTGTCGCGKSGGQEGGDENEDADTDDAITEDDTLTQEQSDIFTTESNDNLTVSEPGGVEGVINGKNTTTVGDITYEFKNNPDGPNILFDSDMIQQRRQDWMDIHQEELQKMQGENRYIYVTTESNAIALDKRLGNDQSTEIAWTSQKSLSYPGEDERFTGIMIKETYKGEVVNADPNGQTFKDGSYSNSSALLHENGHALLDEKFGNFGENNSQLNNLFKAQQELINEGGIKNAVSVYSASDVAEFSAETYAKYIGGATPPTNPNAIATYNETVNYYKSTGVVK